MDHPYLEPDSILEDLFSSVRGFSEIADDMYALKKDEEMAVKIIEETAKVVSAISTRHEERVNMRQLRKMGN